MDAKLTLQLDKAVIERAKAYAAICNTSLSKLIEAYLDELTRRPNSDPDAPLNPLVKSLHGLASLPVAFDEQGAYFGHLLEKHSPTDAADRIR